MDLSTLKKHTLAMLKKPLTLKETLLSVSDFRINRRKKYSLYEILMIAVCGMIVGAKRKELTWDDNKLLKLMIAA